MLPLPAVTTTIENIAAPAAAWTAYLSPLIWIGVGLILASVFIRFVIGLFDRGVEKISTSGDVDGGTDWEFSRRMWKNHRE